MDKYIYPATVLCDFYKISHREQYPPKTTGNLYLVTAHCEPSIFDGKVFDHYDGVYTTNTILGLEHKNNKLKIFDYKEMSTSTH